MRREASPIALQRCETGKLRDVFKAHRRLSSCEHRLSAFKFGTVGFERTTANDGDQERQHAAVHGTCPPLTVPKGSPCWKLLRDGPGWKCVRTVSQPSIRSTHRCVLPMHKNRGFRNIRACALSLKLSPKINEGRREPTVSIFNIQPKGFRHATYTQPQTNSRTLVLARRRRGNSDAGDVSDAGAESGARCTSMFRRSISNVVS